MKIFMLANPESVHTRKWVTSLCGRGIEIVLCSMSDFDAQAYQGLPGFSRCDAGYSRSFTARDSKWSKLGYLTAATKVRRHIKKEKPDILHAHYASGYGLTGALCGFHPYIISVWGSDVYDFPNSSGIARRLLKYSLGKADIVLSTSHAMAQETGKYYKRRIEVTPFGIDTAVFRKQRCRNLFNDDDIVIGTIKSFEKVYGIEYLIRAFAIAVRENASLPLKLLLVGKGSCEKEYRKLCTDLEISDRVTFAGYVDHSKIAELYNNMDIFAVTSIRESFGVAVIEASACELPVVVTNTGGLPEVVANEQSGFITECCNTDAIALALSALIRNKELRLSMGKNGRELVERRYSQQPCVDRMIKIYEGMLKNTGVK